MKAGNMKSWGKKPVLREERPTRFSCMILLKIVVAFMTKKNKKIMRNTFLGYYRKIDNKFTISTMKRISLRLRTSINT